MQIIKKYFPDLTETQIKKFTDLQSIYTEWNKKVNLISRKDIDELYLKHILHSLAIAKFIQFQPNTKIVDLGTGGGFPGIPLAIMFPEAEFTLVDSIGKKIIAVQDIIKQLNLSNTTVINDRVENLNLTPHFYTSRAVAKLSDQLSWINQNISSDNFNQIKNGLITLKGGDLADELEPFKLAETTPINKYFLENFFETKFIIYYPIKK